MMKRSELACVVIKAQAVKLIIQKFGIIGRAKNEGHPKKPVSQSQKFVFDRTVLT